MKYSVLSLKNSAPVVWIIVSIALFMSGILLMLNLKFAWLAIEIVVAGLVFAVGVMYLVSTLLKTTEQKMKHFLIGLLVMFGGIALFAVPQIVKGTFSLTAGLLGIMIGTFIFINSIKLKIDGAPWVTTLFTSLAYIILGVEMAFLPDKENYLEYY